MHTGSIGTPQNHMRQVINSEISLDHLFNNTKVLRINADFNRLQTSEALYIGQSSPTPNQRNTGSHCTLRLHSMPPTQNFVSAAT